MAISCPFINWFVLCTDTISVQSDFCSGYHSLTNLLFNNVALLGHVKTIQELRWGQHIHSPHPSKMRNIEQGKTYLTDILVSDLADLLDIGSGLRDGLEGVTLKTELILLRSRDVDLDSWLHDDLSDNLLTNKVSVYTRQSPIHI